MIHMGPLERFLLWVLANLHQIVIGVLLLVVVFIVAWWVKR